MDFQHDVKTFETRNNPDGSIHVSYTGSAVILPKIDFNALLKARDKLSMSEYVAKQASATADRMQKANDTLRESMKTAVNDATNDFLDSHRGGYDKQGCGRRAQAEMIVRAVAGESMKEILKGRYTYDRYGHKRCYGRSQVFKALAVKGEDNYKRITKLIFDFPDVFQGTSTEAVYAWMAKKASKGGEK